MALQKMPDVGPTQYFTSEIPQCRGTYFNIYYLDYLKVSNPNFCLLLNELPDFFKIVHLQQGKFTCL